MHSSCPPGPGIQAPTVSISGSEVNETLSFPPPVPYTFNLNDDIIALEDAEMYVLLLASLNPRVLIGNGNIVLNGVSYRMRLMVFIVDDDSEYCRITVLHSFQMYIQKL